MTYRLIGLMSVVLLLCLAAFALLAGHLQEQVMAELGRTIAAVGRDVLRSLEAPPRPEEPARALSYDFEVREGAAGPRERRVIVVRKEASAPPGEGGTPAPPEAASASSEGPGGGEAQEAHESRADHEIRVIQDRSRVELFVRVDDVQAEPQAGRGLVLRIPTQAGAPGATATWVESSVAGGERRSSGPVAPGETPAPRSLAALGEDIVLPVATGDYQDLFSELRGRSLLLFLTVFAIGTALSASLASRFLKPVRSLDVALRELADGNLEASVPAGGRDEVGRLGRAFNDLAARLRASRDRERELKRRERLQALGRLAAGVAHDVRNPLHSIGLTLTHMQQAARPQDPARAREFDESLGLIRGEIRRLDELVGSFLRFARGGKRERSPLDFRALLEESQRLLGREAARRGVTIELCVGARAAASPETESSAEQEPLVVGDPQAIGASILNLVLNSFEALPEGGRVTLRVRNEAEAVIVEVSDNGRGIPEPEQERVFDFAYSTREDGHGLGLAMVHHVVVEDHGGRVRLHSRPGAGTTIELAFPRREGAEACGQELPA